STPDLVPTRTSPLSSIPTSASLADAIPTVDSAVDASLESELQSEVFIEHVPLRVKVANLIAILLPLAGLVTAAVLLWGWGFSWTHLGLMIGMYLISILGVTVGYHRLVTHKSFETSQFMKVFLA